MYIFSSYFGTEVFRFLSPQSQLVLFGGTIYNHPYQYSLLCTKLTQPKNQRPTQLSLDINPPAPPEVHPLKPLVFDVHVSCG